MHFLEPCKNVTDDDEHTIMWVQCLIVPESVFPSILSVIMSVFGAYFAVAVYYFPEYVYSRVSLAANRV